MNVTAPSVVVYIDNKIVTDGGTLHSQVLANDSDSQFKRISIKVKI